MPDTNLREMIAHILTPVAPPVTMEAADGWLVVSRSAAYGSVIPPYRYDYSYDHFDREADATEFYGEIEKGEYGPSREAVTLLPCRRGVPLGAKKVL